MNAETPLPEMHKNISPDTLVSVNAVNTSAETKGKNKKKKGTK